MTQNFIKSVVAWLSTNDIDCHISEKYSILGWQEEQNYSKVLNFIILYMYAKYYIYLTRCKEQSLSLLVFKYKLKFMFKVHKQIAYTEEKHETCLKEWRQYL